jgi:hypothetical protein
MVQADWIDGFHSLTPSYVGAPHRFRRSEVKDLQRLSNSRCLACTCSLVQNTATKNEPMKLSKKKTVLCWILQNVGFPT